MHHALRVRPGWVAAFVAALAVAAGTGWAQRSTLAPPAPTTGAPSESSLPAGDGAAALRAAFAALVDLGAAERGVVSFVDHAAVRAGGASAPTWSGRRVAIGLLDLAMTVDPEAVEAATGVVLAEVATTVVVDAEVRSFLTLVRGGVDADRLDAALTARGYAAWSARGDVAGTGGSVRRWCGPDGCDGFQIDRVNRDPAVALFGGVFGRVFPAALSGDLLVVGPAVETIDANLATAAGLAPSFLDRPEMAALVDALDLDAVVRQVWLPLGEHTTVLAPPGSRSMLLADARRGGDEWLLLLVAFEEAADADAFSASALEALGLRGDAAFGPSTLQTALRARAAEAAVDTVAHHGLQVVRLLVARPFSDGVGTLEDPPAALLTAMLIGIMRFELPWMAR